MSKRIYVENLPTTFTSSQVRDLFGKYGNVTGISLARDGSAYVDMESGGDKAINYLHQREMGGRLLNVNEARPRQ